MKHLIILTLVLLLISLGGNYIQWRSAETERKARFEDNQRAQDKAAQDLEELDVARAYIHDILNELKASREIHAQNQSGLKTQIKGLKLKIVKGPLILHDTIIWKQDSLIADLENERDTLYLVGGPAVDSLKSSNEKLRAMFVEQLDRNVRLDEKLFRERRKRFGLGVIGGYGFNGPTIGVGISYNIWKF